MKSISLTSSCFSTMSPSGHRLSRVAILVVALGALTASVLAQAPATPDANDPNARQRRRGQNGDANANPGGGRGNFDPAAQQERMMTMLKEQFAVTDDAEWALIAERIAKLSEIRRSAGGGRGGFAGGAPGGGAPGGGGGNRPTRTTGNPEVESLRAAITDKLPDAEIKSRLARVREVRKDNEIKLTKAQEDLRAVLSVRQEAVAVMFGLLP
jgi:hypothetical protein